MSKLTKDDKIFIAGHNGMVGSAIERKFIQEGFKNIMTFSSKELDLRDQLLPTGAIPQIRTLRRSQEAF